MNDIKVGEIQVKGLAELTAKLDRFTDKLARNVVAGAIRAGSVIVQNEARKKAPVSGGPHWLGKAGSKSRVLVLPGTMRKNIKVRKAPRSKSRYPVEYWVYVSRKFWYWRFVEFGTSKIPAKPFLRPAFEAMKSRALDRIRDYLAARIEKEATSK